MSAGKENAKVLTEMWEELVALEIYGETPEEPRKAKDDVEKRWLEEYEAMKNRNVKLVRTGGKLHIEGL